MRLTNELGRRELDGRTCNDTLVAEEGGFDLIAQQMAVENMGFLHARRFFRRHANAAVDKPLELASSASGEAHAHQAFGPCRFDSRQNIARVPTGRDRYGHVASGAQGLELPREDRVERVIIAD